MEVVHRWAELESNLEAQAQLVREDRVQIAGGIRQTDQAKNLEVQLASEDRSVEIYVNSRTPGRPAQNALILVY